MPRSMPIAFAMMVVRDTVVGLVGGLLADGAAHIYRIGLVCGAS